MSLLNDALRKKKAEQLSSAPKPLKTAMFRLRPRRVIPNARHALAGMSLVLTLVAAGWWWWTPGRAANRVPEPMPAAVSEQPAAAPQIEQNADTALHQSAQAEATHAVQPPPSPAKVPAGDDGQAAVQAKNVPAAGHGSAPGQKQTVQPPEKSSAAPSRADNRAASVTRLYRKGVAYHRQGQMADAIAMYREVLKIDPDHFDTAFNLTSAYLQTQAFDKAYAMASDLYRKRPQNSQVALNLAVSQIGVGQPRQAIALLDAMAKDPRAPLYEIYFHKGVAYRNIDEPDLAVGWYQKAEQLNAGDPRLLFNMAVALDQDQKYEAAVNYYLKFLQASKGDDQANHREVSGRIRTLRAHLAAYPDEKAKTQ
ncbi:tetratricopeptide repeat protein [Desulfatitalea tepidiphila]|uniref:tetratricopeptide repeat protein n=1 Tax=Desulfatitalea tepidiphila TaxID=1185843 RepID=UPI0006B4325D|nr:tetratricopeptide repeat protein [Desulfatitalea tepidiphila]